tara:strand:- start:2543 stop:3772 length:1230 start_codon:yes stop_codon:yes gene_type:complete
MTVINTNISANITANSLAKNERAMSQTMERLSTGMRINSAADDAAGLAISQRLNSQVKGLDQAARNANDAISMLQTADGAAIEITNMLQRMRELTVQSASDTNTSADVANMDLEFKALATEIDRIVDATQWNGESILSGTGGDSSDGTFVFQIGANDDQTITVDFADFNLAAGAAVAASDAVEASDAETAVYSIPAAAISADGTVAQVISDGTTTLTITQAAEATIAEQVTAIQGADGYDSMLFTVDAGDDSVVFTYASAGAVTDPTVTEGDSDVTVTESTAGADAVEASDAVVASAAGPMGADLSGMTDDDASITTSSTDLLATLDAAISGVTSQRATLGAAMNRLEYTVDNLANVSQNTSASMSRIQDADYAAETTELARTQIIQQAGTAMLSQANQQAQSVLALLK